MSAITSDTGYISVYEDIILSGEIPAEVMEQVTTASTEEQSEEATAPETTAESVSVTEVTNGDEAANE